MNNLYKILALLVFLCGCNSASTQSDKKEISAIYENKAIAYGQSISTEDAVSASEVPQLLKNQDSLYVRLSSNAISSCTKKGCWMLVDLGKNQNMRVTFKDYGFFVPKDLNGEAVVMEGTLRRELSSVDEQRHYAEDAGKSQQEIAAIQQPDTAYTFEAVGVKIWPLQPKK